MLPKPHPENVFFSGGEAKKRDTRLVLSRSNLRSLHASKWVVEGKKRDLVKRIILLDPAGSRGGRAAWRWRLHQRALGHQAHFCLMHSLPLPKWERPKHQTHIGGHSCQGSSTPTFVLAPALTQPEPNPVKPSKNQYNRSWLARGSRCLLLLKLNCKPLHSRARNRKNWDLNRLSHFYDHFIIIIIIRSHEALFALFQFYDQWWSTGYLNRYFQTPLYFCAEMKTWTKRRQ